jgi:hypothetical protein
VALNWTVQSQKKENIKQNKIELIMKENKISDYEKIGQIKPEGVGYYKLYTPVDVFRVIDEDGQINIIKIHNKKNKLTIENF